MLPSPPSTSHRDKENRFRCVVWSPSNQYRSLAAASSSAPPASASSQPPTKSILKKSLPLLPILEPAQREITPEPADPLISLSYLTSPVERIVAPDPTLRELIEAYSILAARLRATVTNSTDADMPWPLFQPLRKHREAVVNAITRDLGRALVDPNTTYAGEHVDEPEEEKEEDLALLPSPKGTPKKKRKGMTAEQAKYARDLCTISHAVLKLLAVVFTIPALYSIFIDKQLQTILTEVLAIPLAPILPTPNARKTCALTIWLLQVQRLPASVLLPARDRIAYAIRRGIDGELGKEGKKGSASDGLRAIHDLATYQPSTFLPAFTALIPTILANLLAPTLALRTHACHALGGLAFALSSLPPSALHTRIAAHISAFILPSSTPTPSPTKSPNSASSDPPIIRTLRTTLAAIAPQQAAQGPVWALCVLAAFTVLLGPALRADARLARTIAAQLALAMRHKRSSVRALMTLVWRPLTWAYLHPGFPREEVDEEGEEREVTPELEAGDNGETLWRVLKSVVDMGAGVGIIAAVLGQEVQEDKHLERALTIVKLMVARGGQMCGDAIEILKKLVSPISTPDPPFAASVLLPRGLFIAHPGLLTTEFTGLANTVKSLFAQCAQLDDVRALTRDEIARPSVFSEVVALWRTALSSLEFVSGEGESEWVTPEPIVDIWDGLIKANVAALQDEGDDDGTSAFAVRCVDVLVDILQDANLDLTLKAPSVSSLIPTSPISPHPTAVAAPTTTLCNAAIKLTLVRDFWRPMRTAIPHTLLHAAGTALLACLVRNEDEYCESAARPAWAQLAAEVLLVNADVEVTLREFWRDAAGWDGDVAGVVWRCFVDAWRADAEGGWEGAVVLLGVPLSDTTTWDLSADDLQTWDLVLQHALNKALDYGVDGPAVLEHVARTLAEAASPTSTLAPRVADVLLAQLDVRDAREVPTGVVDFVNGVLSAAYPPAPRDVVTACWLLRTVTRTLEMCPGALLLGVLEGLQEGLCVWLGDECGALSAAEYGFDVLPLYETILLCVRDLPATRDVLQGIAGVLEAPLCGRRDRPAGVCEAFVEAYDLFGDTMREPVEEWAVRLQRCRRVACGEAEEGDEDALHGVSGDDEDVAPLLVPQTMDVPDEQPEHDIMPTPTDTEVASQVVFKMLEPPTTPTRPTSARSLFSTPSRPHKSVIAFPSFPLRSPGTPLPASHRAPTTPKRTPLGQASPKRRRIADKENESPIASAEEGKSRSVGKRRAADGWEEGRAGKRGKSESEAESDSEDERAVAASLAIAELPRMSLFNPGTQVVNPRKRKGVFLDAVELPTLVQVRRLQRAASMDSEFTTPSKGGLRRSRSALKLLRGDEVEPRFRRRHSDNFRTRNSSSLRGVIVNSDDSIVQSGHASSEQSSDDDPHVGQVTPHHIISPAVRRSRSHPPSDDSQMSSSPSRDAQSRLIQRTRSLPAGLSLSLFP